MASKKIDPKECPSYLNDFFTNQRVVKIRAERTIESYYIDLRLFLRFVKLKKGGIDPDTPIEQITISDVPIEYVRSMTKLDIYDYLNYIATERNNSGKTRHRKLASLKMFYKCLNRDLNLITEDPTKDVDYPKMKESIPRYLDLNKSISLLENMNTKDPYYSRDYCIITLFVNCGMRLSELVGINMQDVNLDERTLRLLGKGNKERIIHINDACAAAIVQYLDERRSSPDEPNALFLSKRGTRISGRRVQQVVDNALRDSNLDNQGYSTHKLRHTAATLMHKYGNADMRVLQAILGHKNVSTTEIYTHIDDETVMKAMDASPLANIQNNQKQSKRTAKK